jgi:dipeptidyl aminopeptidase/acylaminoacyl peptidase
VTIGVLTVVAFSLLGAVATRESVRVFARERAVFHPRQGAVVSPARSADFTALSDVAFTSPDGARLHGWLVPPRNGALVILLHGSQADRRQMLPQAALLSARGYGVLLFDWPGHGESSGSVHWDSSEREALKAAVDFVGEQPFLHAPRIGVLGFSMGGAIAAQVAGADDRLRAVVLEATFADALEQTRWLLGARAGLLKQWPARLACWWEGMDLLGMRPADAVRSISPRPVLVIGGSKDTAVPSWMVQELFDAAREPKELWVIPEAEHGGYDRAAPEEYPRRIGGFFDRTLRPPQ